MIHIPTLLGYTGILLLVMAMVALVLRPAIGRSWWFVVPFLSGGVGCLALVQPGVLPGRWAGHLGALAISLAYAFGWQAVRAVYDLPARIGWLLIPSLCWLLLTVLVFDPMDWRTCNACIRVALVGAYCAMAALELWRRRAEQLPSHRALRYVFEAAAGLAFLSLPLTRWLPEPLGAAPVERWAVVFFNLQVLCEVLLGGTLIVAMRKERRGRRYYEEAMRDPLTGLYNRRFLDQRLAEWATAAIGRDRAVLFFDIDHFKAVNDRYGHHVGDEVISVVARVAGQVLRKRDWMFRYGGEEFLCVLPDHSLEEARAVGERVRVAVERDVAAVKRLPSPVTVSVGVAASMSGEAMVEGLIEQADRLLYLAKAQGRNRVVSSPS